MKNMESVYIDDSAKVGDDVSIGNSSKVWHNCQIRSGAKIGQNCTLSKDVYIGVSVEVGDNCKIQNGVSVYEGVTIEDNVFCGPHMTFTNDSNIRINPDDYEPIPTHVEKWVSIGAHATILPGITIRRYAIVGAQSLVTKDVPAFALVYGNPARIQGIVCYCGEKLISADEMGEESEFRCSECGEVVNINREAFSERANS